MIKLAEARDEATGNAIEVYQLLQEDGTYVTIEVGREIACDEAAFRKELNRKPSLLPRDRDGARPIIAAATMKPPKEQWLYAAQLGWWGEMRQLVKVNGVIGDDPGPVKLMPPRNLTRNQRRALKKAGTLKEWKKMIKLAKYSSCALFLLAVACAAPLLRFMGLPSFVVCFYGASKIGKSTALLLASSTIGIGRENELPNLNTTVAAFQEKAGLFSDLLVPANETALLKVVKKNTSEQLTELVYKFAEGVETARHSKSTYTAPDGAAAWSGILAMTSEESLSALSAIAGVERKGGEMARAIDVPARLTDDPTIFNEFPEDRPVEERKEWARQALKKIREGCAANHGVVLEPYGEYLIEKGPETVKAETERYMSQLRADLDLEGASEATLHAALCCSLIYAGGLHAIEAGILPIKKTRLKRAVLSCTRQALRVSEQEMSLSERARAKIIEKLQLAYPDGGKRSPERAGKIYRLRKGDAVKFAVPSAEFKAWFRNQPELAAALRWLHEERLLKTVQGATPSPHKMGWAVTFPKIKGAGKRCIVFADPGHIAA
jgi:putative DNA primase/helicase